MNEIVDYFGDTYKICSTDEAADDSAPMLTVEVESTWNNMLIWARRFFDFVEILSPDSLRQKQQVFSLYLIFHKQEYVYDHHRQSHLQQQSEK